MQKRIIGVDMLPERLAMAKQLGVMDHGYLATTEGLPQIIAELTHGGADVALDCSGNAAGRLLALQSTADWGRVVYIGETGKVEFEVSADSDAPSTADYRLLGDQSVPYGKMRP